MGAKTRMVDGLARLPTVQVFGPPDLWAFAYGSSDVDMHRVAARMGERGWYCGRTTSPRGIHMMCTPVHARVADEYVADVALCLDAERARVSAAPGAAAYS